MRAVLLTGHGGFERLEYRSDIPVPQPRAGEVLIRVGAAGVNNTDINTRIGWYSKSVTSGTEGGGTAGSAAAGDAAWAGDAVTFPRIQGADACGTIAAVGAGVDAAHIGERVLVEPCFRRADGGIVYFGSDCDGAFAEFAAAPAEYAHAVRCGLTDAELATFPCSYSAAENMLARAGVAAGETVLVTGASGGVGSAAVQLARRRGARVIALAGEAKAEAVASLGVDRVLPRGADLLAALGRESVDAAIDSAGGAQVPALLEVLRRGGRYAVAGAIAGPVVSIDLRTVYLKDLRLLGCTVLEREVFPNLVAYIERGEIRPVLAGTYKLSEIVAAQQAFLAKRHVGKIVLLPSG
jgi:NADPH:quinone reductase-like Zn-dependent oxidoreductase